MSRVADSWRDYRDRASVQEFGQADREAIPEVSDLMCGKPDASRTAWERPPLSLRLYLDGDFVKFVFSSTEFPLELWGSFKGLKDAILGVEEALCRSNCDWRKKKHYDNGFTHRQR